MSLLWSKDNSAGVVGGVATTVATLLLYKSYYNSLPQAAPDRPQLVLDALEKNEPVYYFAVGSNLSRKKLENRSICGKKIHILSMEPCVIPHHRLAFNMRAYPPLEPAMGGLEPLPSFYEQQSNDENDKVLVSKKNNKLEHKVSFALKPYERQECHGALIKLSAQDYERVHESEGGKTGALQGYEEIEVTCIPYDKSKPPVKAIAYRTREHVRLAKDPCPSQRYMKIIKEGARELGLRECYLQWLEEHPVQHRPSAFLKSLAVNSMVFNITLTMLSFRLPAYLQNRVLFMVYVLPTEARWKQIVSEIFSGFIMVPTACCGALLRTYLVATGKMPERFQAFIDNLNEE